MLKDKWLVVSKMKWGIWWISPEHLQILKFAIWETFPSKVYDVELKHYRGVMCHDTEGWYIKKKQLTGGLKNDIRNLVNFHGNSRKSENLYLHELLLPIVYKVSAKKAQKCYLSWHCDPNFEEKLTFCLKNDMRNLVNFNADSGKSENLHSDGLLLSKVCNIWAK